ncbi:MAG: hypothetical protein IT445_02505 [Phycisphaeraceae bacterium]|nr:hypothetical protein [Phycisphaeraceae bacterium]
MKHPRLWTSIRTTGTTFAAYLTSARWFRWALAVFVIALLAAAYYPEVAYWIDRARGGNPYGLAQRWPFGERVSWRPATPPMNLRNWSAKYHFWISPLTRDGIVFSLLLFYLLARRRRSPLTRRYILTTGMISYLFGCAISVWLFYLKFGYFRFLEPANRYGFWEELARPIIRAFLVWQGQMEPLNKGGFQHTMETVWPYYIRVPLIILAVFCMSSYLIIKTKRKQMHGYCWKCGYDLRGNVRSTRCPECGSVVSRPEFNATSE